MKLSNKAQSATSYILINLEPYKAIRARDIEPSPLKFQKFIENPYNGENDSILEFRLTSIPWTYEHLQNAFVSHRSDFIRGHSFERY